MALYYVLTASTGEKEDYSILYAQFLVIDSTDRVGVHQAIEKLVGLVGEDRPAVIDMRQGQFYPVKFSLNADQRAMARSATKLAEALSQLGYPAEVIRPDVLVRV